MRLGNLNLKGRVWAAPLAGVSNRPFRVMATHLDAALVFTEMVSCEGIIRTQKKTMAMMEYRPDEQPLGIQLFGGGPETMKKAAEIVVERYQPDLIDINFGCPVNKVVRRGEGAGTLKDVKRANDLMIAVVEGAGETPVTVKMRIGWDSTTPVYLEIGKMAQDAGVVGVTLHARTRTQMFSGQADWSAIKKLKDALDIAVIGNGDITSPEDAQRMIDETGCDAVMIGRAALGNPYIFRLSHRYLEHGERMPDPTMHDWIDMARYHARLIVDAFGEDRGCKMMRRYLGWYVKGFRGATQLRPKLFQVERLPDIDRTFDEYLIEHGYEPSARPSLLAEPVRVLAAKNATAPPQNGCQL